MAIYHLIIHKYLLVYSTLPSPVFNILEEEAERNLFAVADIHHFAEADTLLAEDTETVACYTPVVEADHIQVGDSAHSHTLVVEVDRHPVVVGGTCPAAGRNH